MKNMLIYYTSLAAYKIFKVFMLLLFLTIAGVLTGLYCKILYIGFILGWNVF